MLTTKAKIDCVSIRCCDPVLSSAADPLSSAATPSPSLLHLCRSALDLLHAAVAVGSKVIRDLLLLGNNTLRLTQLLVLWRRGVEIQNSIQLTQYYSTIHTVHSHLQKTILVKKPRCIEHKKLGIYINQRKNIYQMAPTLQPLKLLYFSNVLPPDYSMYVYVLS